METRKFETQEEAEVYQKEVMGKTLGYCPVASIDCISRCVCYVDSKVLMNSPNSWSVYPPYCDNHMYWGE